MEYESLGADGICDFHEHANQLHLEQKECEGFRKVYTHTRRPPYQPGELQYIEVPITVNCSLETEEDLQQLRDCLHDMARTFMLEFSHNQPAVTYTGPGVVREVNLSAGTDTLT